MKKKFKSFFTLKHGANGGFTLVELIVVVAILGILGGVGVPAYSGYVEKTNKQADISLAAEIKQALMLAHYSDKLEEGASVVVHYGEPGNADSDVQVSGDGAEAAMKAAFGENYAETLRLKHNGWSMGVMADADAMANVQDSSFKGKNLGYLLGDVQNLTEVILTTMNNGLFTPSEELKDYMKNLGLDPENPQEVSNASVMYVANCISGIMSTEAAEGQPTNEESFVDAWTGDEFSTGAFNPLLGSAAEGGGYNDTLYSSAAAYAKAEALATFIDSELAAQGLSSGYANELRAATTGDVPHANAAINAGMTGINEALVRAGEGGDDEADLAVATAYYKYFGWDLEGNELSGTPQAEKDAKAFLSYMEGVDTVAPTLVDKTDVASDNYYGNDEILSYVTGYITAGEALTEYGDIEGSALLLVYKNDHVISSLDY